MKERRYYSRYLKRDVCTECDWFKSPNATLSYGICPDCGSELKSAAGRYKILETKTFFGTYWTHEAFLLKEDE